MHPAPVRPSSSSTAGTAEERPTGCWLWPQPPFIRTLNYWEETAQTKATGAKVVAFNGEDSSPTTGKSLDDQGNRAKSLAGHLLFHLGGAESLQQFREGDERLTDPGADEFRRLIGNQPTVIMIDELVHYINKVRQRIDSGDQISLEGALSTVSALASAVSSCPNAVLIITSPEDAHGNSCPNREQQVRATPTRRTH